MCDAGVRVGAEHRHCTPGDGGVRRWIPNGRGGSAASPGRAEETSATDQSAACVPEFKRSLALLRLPLRLAVQQRVAGQAVLLLLVQLGRLV